MQLVIDANAFFSALLKDSLARTLMFDRRLLLYSPQFLLIEFKKYREELQQRSKIPASDFTKLAGLILSRIKLVPEEEFISFVPAANSLIIDPKDVPYLACALAVNADIWSRDPHLLQPRVKRWTTGEIARHLGYFY